MLIHDLKKIAKHRQIKKYYTLRKKELENIIETDNASSIIAKFWRTRHPEFKKRYIRYTNKSDKSIIKLARFYNCSMTETFELRTRNQMISHVVRHEASSKIAQEWWGRISHVNHDDPITLEPLCTIPRNRIFSFRTSNGKWIGYDSKVLSKYIEHSKNIKDPLSSEDFQRKDMKLLDSINNRLGLNTHSHVSLVQLYDIILLKRTFMENQEMPPFLRNLDGFWLRLIHYFEFIYTMQRLQDLEDIEIIIHSTIDEGSNGSGGGGGGGDSAPTNHFMNRVFGFNLNLNP